MQGVERVAVTEWSQILAGLTPMQIKHGLDTWREDWPPSAPEFHDACTGKRKGLNEFGLDYVPAYYRRSDAVTDRSRLLSSAERDAKRESIQAGIVDLRAALRGGMQPEQASDEHAA